MIAFSHEEIIGVVGDRFRRVAAAIPDHVAVNTPQASITYAELDRASDDLARAILARRGPAEEPVALLLKQGTDSVMAALAIIKAGKSAVVLSPDQPLDKLAAIWEDAQKPLVITDRPLGPMAAELTGQPALWLDFTAGPDRSFDLDSIHPRPGTLAALFYTSGTTGEPKGVMIPNELILHNAWFNYDRYQISQTDHVALMAAHGFSASMSLSLCMILIGATLHLRPGQINQLNVLVDWLRREEMTHIILTPLALLRQQSSAMKGRVSLPHLRYVVSGGEEFRREELERYQKFLPETTAFSYRMGSTETMMMCEQTIRSGTPIPWEKIPVGRILPDKELLILDNEGRPVPPGELGEIAIRSRFVAQGYWQKPELTKARFLPDPEGGDLRIHLTGDIGRLLPDGLLEHMGRKDNLVKVRGFSIQLEAVEKALQKIPGVREATAAVVPFPGGNPRLVAYVVRSDKETPTLYALRQALVATLPAHMIPTVYVFLDAIPRTQSGRVDRKLLPLPGTGRPELETPFVEPRTDLERRLCSIWAEIIGVDRVGVNDDFFLLGGDSLLAMHMVLQVEESQKNTVPSAFFRNPTISSLTDLWQSAGAEADSPDGREPRASLVKSAATPAKAKPAFNSRRKPGSRPRYQDRTTPLGPRSIRLRKRIPRLVAEHLTLLLSYPLGCRWLSGWCRRPFVVDQFYPAEKQLFRRWVDSLGSENRIPPEAVNIYLMSNILWSPRFKKTIPDINRQSSQEALRHSSAPFFRDMARIVASGPAEKFNRFFVLEGVEYVEQALRQERGVIILTYHGAANRFASAALPRLLNRPTIPTLSLGHGMKIRRREPSHQWKKINDAALLASSALEGHRLLRQGGIIQIIPDIGYDAADGLPVNIAGHRFLLKPGFAELALLSEAVIVPQYSTRRIDGCVVIRFGPPFDPGSNLPGNPAKVEHLMDQYAAFVEKSWQTAPESLLWQVIDTHMNRPTEAG